MRRMPGVSMGTNSIDCCMCRGTSLSVFTLHIRIPILHRGSHAPEDHLGERKKTRREESRGEERIRDEEETKRRRRGDEEEAKRRRRGDEDKETRSAVNGGHSDIVS